MDPPHVKWIHFVWMQGEAHLKANRPKLYAYVQTWKTYFPNWRHTIWDEPAILSLISQLATTFPKLALAYQNLSKAAWAIKSDLARYLIVYAHGGMYVDTDMECLGNFEHLLAGPDPKILYDSEISQTLGIMEVTNNCWFCAPTPGCKGLRELVTAIAEKLTKDGRKNVKPALFDVFKLTGPTH